MLKAHISHLLPCKKPLLLHTGLTWGCFCSGLVLWACRSCFHSAALPKPPRMTNGVGNGSFTWADSAWSKLGWLIAVTATIKGFLPQQNNLKKACDKFLELIYQCVTTAHYERVKLHLREAWSQCGGEVYVCILNVMCSRESTKRWPVRICSAQQANKMNQNFA